MTVASEYQREAVVVGVVLRWSGTGLLLGCRG